MCACAFHSSTHIDAAECFIHIDIHIPCTRNIETDLTETVIDMNRCALSLDDRIIKVYAGRSETVIDRYAAKIVGVDLINRLSKTVVEAKILSVALLAG